MLKVREPYFRGCLSPELGLLSALHVDMDRSVNDLRIESERKRDGRTSSPLSKDMENRALTALLERTQIFHEALSKLLGDLPHDARQENMRQMAAQAQCPQVQSGPVMRR